MESAIIQIALGVGGLSGSMLLVWFITQQQLKTTIKTITDQNKEQVEAITKQYGRMIDFQRDADKRSFELMERILDLSQMQIAALSRVETKIDSNQYCPMARKGSM